MTWEWEMYELESEDICSRCGEHKKYGYIDDMGEVIICQDCAEVMESDAIDADIDQLMEDRYYD